ncbi:MAG TPA: hypothetical protein ENJ84_10215, partial [Gammaproteobacteria bacterium]|nr:hypothetical protein [Gammaproteobacteria bacterium]
MNLRVTSVHICTLLLLLASHSVWAKSPSVAFYYADNPPVDILSQFDWVILESENISTTQRVSVQQNGAKTFAYLSIGEANRHRSWWKQVKSDWILGENTTWDSAIMDLTHPGWQQFVLQRAQKLWQAGYRGFFLDTMDSYLIQSTNKADQQKQQAALVQLVHRLKQQLPNALIITNRGFEVIPDIARDIDAVAAESLYAQWNNNDQNYQPVATEDHDWLINQLQNIQSEYSLDIIAIDYLPPSQRQQARTIAKKILDQGFIPWVATPAFDYV